LIEIILIKGFNLYSYEAQNQEWDEIFKEDDKVKEKEESEEPPKWFLMYAAVVTRIEKAIKCHHGTSRWIEGEKYQKKATNGRGTNVWKRWQWRIMFKLTMSVNLRIFQKSFVK